VGMFRVRDHEVPSRTSLLAGSVLLVQVLALLIDLGTIGALYAVTGSLGRAEVSAGGSSIGPFASFWGWCILLGLLAVAVIQVVGILAFRRVRRRYVESQQSLRQVKLLAYDILASMDLGVITTDRQGIVTSINSAAIRLLGVDFDCVGRPIASLTTAEVPLDQVARRVIDRPGSVPDEVVLARRGEGQPRRILIHAHDLKGSGDEGFGCVIHLRDVTERMLMQERMWRMEQVASLGALAAGLHHEIKNPLTAVSIHVQLLEESLRAEACEPGVGELLGVLKAETMRLGGVLERLASVTRLIGPQADRQGVRLRLIRPEPGGPEALLDVAKVEQAVLNLILNALEAMPGGGDLTLAAGEEPGSVWIEVRDTGPGIPPELQEQLFLPYFSTKSFGTGLGLPLCEKLVNQHGGRITFRTGPSGTAFRITLPSTLDVREESPT
jgi:two-component system sensor histidine kinase HydH